jgi:hypothetical protein
VVVNLLARDHGHSWTLLPTKAARDGRAFSLIAGGLIFVFWAEGVVSGPPFIAAASSALGLGNLWHFRDPTIRAAHIAKWTAQT